MRGGDVTDRVGRGCLRPRRRLGHARAAHHRDAGDETRERQDELAAQHLRMQRVRLVRRAAEEVDDAGLDPGAGPVRARSTARRGRRRERDRLAGLRLPQARDDLDVVTEQLVGVA